MEIPKIGEFVKERRLELQITQEELAAGLCTPGTISKIENGSQMPSELILQPLLERLGVSGFSYWNYYDEIALEKAQLKQNVLESIKFMQYDSVEQKMNRLYRLCYENDPSGMQFYFYVFLLWEYANRCHREYIQKMKPRMNRSASWALLPTEMEIYSVSVDTKKEFRDRAWKLFYMTNPMPKNGHKWNLQMVTQTEMLLFNAIALSYIKEDPKKTLEMLFQLLQIQKIRLKMNGEYWKDRGALNNNIAIALFRLKKYEQALAYCRSAYTYIEKGGGILLLLSLLRTEMLIYMKLKDREKMIEKKMIARNLFEIIPELKAKITFEEFLLGTKALIVF